MNILILNWRDPKNPKSGGAEKLNMHILKPFLDRGDTVTWYAQAVKGRGENDLTGGVKVVRKGNALTHFLYLPFLLWKGKFGNVDLIIDCIHGTGYLTSIIAPKTKKIVMICEVAQNIWDEMYPFPINIIGKLWEKVLYRLYWSNNFWTISQSTKNDLIRFGVPSSRITVLPMGFDGYVLKERLMKYPIPTALFVGRLAEMKGIKDAIKAISGINETTQKKWKLNIIGRGETHYEKELQDLVVLSGQKKHVNFLGFVSEKKKFEEMTKAWVLLVPSSREGWGMIVPEANCVGTAVVGYDVPGLKDSLSKYSKSNKIISKNYNAIIDELRKIDSPPVVHENVKPGWDALYSSIAKLKI